MTKEDIKAEITRLDKHIERCIHTISNPKDDIPIYIIKGFLVAFEGDKKVLFAQLKELE